MYSSQVGILIDEILNIFCFVVCEICNKDVLTLILL